MTRLLLAAALVALCLALAPASRAQTEPWRLHAVEHARSAGLPERRLIRDGDPAARLDMSWYFFVARSGSRVVLVDVGTDLFTQARGRGHRRAWRVARAITVTEALARLELAPADVTDVVLTHHHWDHVGALGSYGAARVHAHPAEWARMPAALTRPVEAGGRLVASRRDGELWPGLSVSTRGAHTRHQRMVRVTCAEGPVWLASDAAYLYRNVSERRAVAVSASPARNLAALSDAVDEVGIERVIPGHDPALFTRHPSGTRGVAAICP